MDLKGKQTRSKTMNRIPGKKSQKVQKPLAAYSLIPSPSSWRSLHDFRGKERTFSDSLKVVVWRFLWRSKRRSRLSCTILKNWLLYLTPVAYWGPQMVNSRAPFAFLLKMRYNIRQNFGGRMLLWPFRVWIKLKNGSASL